MPHIRAAVSFVLTSLAACAAVAQAPIALRNVNVVPMDAERVLEAQTVIVRGERIEALGPASSVAVPDGARVIDGAGRYLVPGLAEMHAHVPGGADPRYVEEVLFLYVANGVTTARGMLGTPEHLALRERLRRHEVLGPRLFTSGPSLSGQSVGSPADAARIVREQARAGYDFVKVHPGLTREEYDAAVAAAAEAGIDLAGHVPDAVGVLRALEARQATIDHLDGYVQLLLPEAAGGLDAGFFGLGVADRVDRARIQSAVAATVAAGVWNVPTHTLIEHWAAPEPSAAELAVRAEMRYVPAPMRAQWLRAKQELTGAPGYSAVRARALVEVRRTLLQALHDGGAGLLLGSDAPQVFNVPGFSLHHELLAVVASGLTPYQALRTGTASPAVFFDAAEEFGTIAPGLAADLLLVDGNPLADIGVLARPAGVMVRGRWLSRAELDAGLAAIEDRYRER